MYIVVLIAGTNTGQLSYLCPAFDLNQTCDPSPMHHSIAWPLRQTIDKCWTKSYLYTAFMYRHGPLPYLLPTCPLKQLHAILTLQLWLPNPSIHPSTRQNYSCQTFLNHKLHRYGVDCTHRQTHDSVWMQCSDHPSLPTTHPLPTRTKDGQILSLRLDFVQLLTRCRVTRLKIGKLASQIFVPFLSCNFFVS